MSKLPRSTPEKQGIPSASIRGFLEDIAGKNLELHSFMMLRNGHVVSEGWWDPYRPDLPHHVGMLSHGHQLRRLGPFHTDRGHRQIRAAVSAGRNLERSPGFTGRMGTGGHTLPYIKWRGSRERLEPGIRLSILALQA